MFRPRLITITVCSYLVFLWSSSAVAAEINQANGKTRLIEFTYKVELPMKSEATGPLDIFIPLAQSGEQQTVVKRSFESSSDQLLRQITVRKEDKYGNEFMHLHLAEAPTKKEYLQVNFLVERRLFKKDNLIQAEGLVHQPQELKNFETFLIANRRVPIDGNLIQKIRGQIHLAEQAFPLKKSRAIYDYVIDNMEYKKVGTGWGNGDTFWACSEKYGNCTDFHALFTSLARAESIPARFEIGFPIPMSSPEGDLTGYHCWLQFHLPKVGWVPVDASEAKKHPENRELFYGTLPADRILFTVGRDLRLGEGHHGPDLNYFIYPHVEVGGKPTKTAKTAFHYKVVSH